MTTGIDGLARSGAGSAMKHKNIRETRRCVSPHAPGSRRGYGFVRRAYILRVIGLALGSLLVETVLW
jgi:hypothetical protein